MIIIVSVECAKRLIVVSCIRIRMLQTVTSSAAVTIDMEDVVSGFGIDEERAGTDSKKFSKYHSKQIIRLLCRCKQPS